MVKQFQNDKVLSNIQKIHDYFKDTADYVQYNHNDPEPATTSSKLLPTTPSLIKLDHLQF